MEKGFRDICACDEGSNIFWKLTKRKNRHLNKNDKMKRIKNFEVENQLH